MVLGQTWKQHDTQVIRTNLALGALFKQPLTGILVVRNRDAMTLVPIINAFIWLGANDPKG